MGKSLQNKLTAIRPGSVSMGGYSVGDTAQSQVPIISVDDMKPAAFFGNARQRIFDGDKFLGGFGATNIPIVDYWTLRARSAQLFNDNLYARGLIRRLITNEINTGLTPEAAPDEKLIGVPEDSLDDWTETVENRFAVWGSNPRICDWRQSNTFGALQRAARTEALVAGDVLVVLRQSQRTRLPMVQLVNGWRVQTPMVGGKPRLKKGHVIKHGVELNGFGRVVAYWVRQDNMRSKRLPAVGEKSGRRLAWLVFGTDKRLDDVRGQPILSLVLQSLREIDRYRDSAQRKAVINSILAMFIKKGDDKPGTIPISAGAVRRDQVDMVDADGTPRTFALEGMIPGLVMETLQTGEEPVGFHSQGIDINFGEFEEAIIQAVAWANEIPPEILRLTFSNNYSASQAAINEFKIYLNRMWNDWGETFCTPIYTDWLLSETLLRKIDAPGLLEAWRDPAKYDVFGAWIMTDWYGSIKPSTDMLKQAKSSSILVDRGWSSNARESRMLTGTRFARNMKRQKRENQQRVEAARPLAEFNQEFGFDINSAVQQGAGSSAQNTAAIVEDVLELIDDENLE